MAHTLAGYLSNTPTEVFHARELGLHNKPDVEWMGHLAATGEDWMIVTGDGRIRKNRAEREAYRRAGLKGLILAPSYQKTPMGKNCGMLVAKWDDIEDFTSKITAPFLVEISINLTPRHKILPL